jgi:hypothetical protein
LHSPDRSAGEEQRILSGQTSTRALKRPKPAVVP